MNSDTREREREREGERERWRWTGRRRDPGTNIAQDTVKRDVD